MRLRRIEEEFDGRVRVAWRSFLLRPQPDPGGRRDLEKFRAYTRSWMRPASEPDSGTFRVWQGDLGPPTHSVPPHLVAKAAATISDDAFQRMHERLLHAYFAENRDITERDTLAALWREVGLPPETLAGASDPALLRATVAEHKQAIALGVTGVPAVCVDGSDAFVVGAQPVELYRRWVRRLLRA